MRVIEGEWEFRARLCRDLAKQPAEDFTVEWKEDEAPFRRVATTKVPRQDSWDAARVVAVNEMMRFIVWTGLTAHRPLGNINRARNAPYQHSAKFRERFDDCPIQGCVAVLFDANVADRLGGCGTESLRSREGAAGQCR